MKLKAIKPLRYGRALVPAGAEFDAARRHARVLLAVGRAEAVRAERVRQRPEAAKDKPKRTYKRRDLVAEAPPTLVRTVAFVREPESAADDIGETDAT